jgi:hypothetical protein
MEGVVFVDAVDVADAMAKAANLNMFNEIKYYEVKDYGFSIEEWRKISDT